MDAQLDALPPRCGDHVHHRPSGEKWVVAFADPATNTVAPAGWPDSRADLSVCDVVKRCSDLEHIAEVAKWESVENDNRRASVLRLYGHVLPAKETGIVVDYAQIERRIEAYVSGAHDGLLPTISPTGRLEWPPLPPSAFAGAVEERNRLRRCMVTQARMLACWGSECFPTPPGGKMHFARALMESASMELTEALGVPYPVEPADPAANPVAGVIETLKRIEHTLTTLNGLWATDIEGKGIQSVPGPTVMQIDVIQDINEVTALLERLRSMPA